ncbi:putative glucose-6-phosphate 1-epimerase [Andrographis paniculata]|uniref:putative glucose-6-phosphate 1-epimerase n=1 Tax=Andrographis paniculata TaxID=175694 RepID=UPI0021E70B53|nr:putative glucose-6-phosphate 1-epimerase [Andrographis paniculata]
MDPSTTNVNRPRGLVDVSKDENGVPRVLLLSPRGASAIVSLHGGQVRSWKTESGEELLFTSSKANLKPPGGVRGGIPICFPQFGSRGCLEKHGFARNRIWVIEDNPPPLQGTDSSSGAVINLLLKSTDDDMKLWPHSFEFRLRVQLNADNHLILTSRVWNVNGKPFSFSFAYHTYFSVSHISEVRVEGLETLDYLDGLRNKERLTDQGDALTFESAMDRVYVGCPGPVGVFDHEKKRTFLIKKEGLPDVVVWNPWDKKSKAIPDFGDNEYKQMLAVDAAVIENPVTLKPGEGWTGRVELAVMPTLG